MRTILTRLSITALTLFALCRPGLSGQLDDYYLSQFAEQPGTALQKAVLFQAAPAEMPHCGTPLKHGLQRDWSKLEPDTQKVLAKQLAAPVLSGSELTLLSPTGRFRIHYTTSGADAIPSISWVQTVAQTFDDVATAYLSRGWRPAPTPAGSPYDVYLRDLAPQKLYGQTTTSQALSSAGFPYAYGSFMEIDNNFTDSIYGSYSATQSLQITAAHEYQHAIQFGYNIFFDTWYAEATSTWYEDELYDGVNQLYNYLKASLQNTNLSLDITTDTSTGGGYGRWLFNRHLSESHGGQVIIRSFWEQLASTAPTSGNDIPMLPIINAVLLSNNSSLGNGFQHYAEKLYTGAWSTHSNEITLIPAASKLSTSGVYPLNVNSIPSPSTTLPHYSFAFFKFTPPSTPPATLYITITNDTGISAVAFRNINNTISTYTATSGSNVIAVPGFNSATEVVLLVANTSSNDNLFAGFSTDGSSIQYALPAVKNISAFYYGTPPSIALSWPAIGAATSYQIYRSSTSSSSLTPYDTATSASYTDTKVVTDHNYYYSIIPMNSVGLTGPASQIVSIKASATAAPASTGGGGGGGGCFIATAAYGSYLHPQVQVLRDFRDRHLLTNAPGRAFVELYYRLSPPLANFIAAHELLRLLTRLALTPLVVAAKYPLPACITMLIAGGLLSYFSLRRRFRASRANC